VAGPWQALIGEGRVGSCELSIAVGRQIHTRETLVVQREWEGQRNGRYRIIPVIADVGRAWHDAAAYLTYHVRANARRRR
jgi:hypothetical protein